MTVADSATGVVLLVTDQSYSELVLSSPVPVLLVFTAGWCGPGRLLEPRLPVVAQKLTGRLRVGVVDCDRSWEATLAHRVFCYPTIILLHRAGEELKEGLRILGARTTRELLELVRPFLEGEA